MNPNRRDFIALGVGAFAVATAPRFLRRRPELVRRQIPVMGTVAEVAVLHRDGAWAQRGIDAAFAELRRVESTMTRFRPDSDVGRVNSAVGQPVSVALETAAVLSEARQWALCSEGRFDPCLGGASELWDVAERHELPTHDDIDRYAGKALWTALDVDVARTAPRVRLGDPTARIDLGGIAKGRGVDLAAQAMRDHGVFQGMVNVGGDLVALGVGPGDEPWRVGVRSPEHADEMMAVLELTDEAVATSGDYLQFFQFGGRRYHHLLDPSTGEPRVTAMRSLTIRAADCTEADAAATALFGADLPTAVSLLALRGTNARVAHSL